MMLRIATILLCLILAAASAGRYRAEVAVRETREAIEQLERERDEENRRIQVLRVELAYLENPERLIKIAREKTDLEPLTGKQLLTGSEFLSAIGASPVSPMMTHRGGVNAKAAQSASPRQLP